MIYILIFFGGYAAGILSLLAVYKIKRPYDGIIKISKVHDGKKMFSLELNRDPLSLEDEEVVTFLVKASEEESRKDN